MTPPLLSAVTFSASYGKQEVLNNASASFSRGEFVCVLGPNGSGKSTFLTQLAGLEIPSLKIVSGDCLLEGSSIKDYAVKERARLVTFLAQNECYSWNYSVLEAVRMGRYAVSKSITAYTADDDTAARKALEMAGIAHLENRYIFELSGGELQAVLIARALAQDTPVMILDEPFTFLDAEKSDRLMQLLREICHRENKCLIMSLHEINAAPVYADRIMIFSDGRIIADGASDSVFTAENIGNAYKAPFVQYVHPVYKVPQICPAH